MPKYIKIPWKRKKKTIIGHTNSGYLYNPHKYKNKEYRLSLDLAALMNKRLLL